MAQLGTNKENPAELVVHIQNQAPIELLDFTQTMTSLAVEYNHHSNTDDVKLYIKKVESGSIIATLMAAAPTLLPFVEHANSVIEFASHLKRVTDYLKGEPVPKPPLDHHTLNNISKIVEPVAKDRGAVINIGTLNVYGNDNRFSINSTEANAIQNAARREMESLKEPISAYQNKVVLYFSQARGDNKKGDKGVIELISKKEVKIAFDSQELKSRMIIEADHNIFDRAYLVDVKVQTVNDKPVLYTITEFYESIELDD